MRHILEMENYDKRKEKFKVGDKVVCVSNDYITVEYGYEGSISDWRYKDGKYKKNTSIYYPDEKGEIQYQIKGFPNVWFNYSDLILKKDFDAKKFDL